jgi:hypothetical protein
MAIFRGVGGSGDSSDNSFLQEVTAQANAAEASATSAQASANSILTLTAATGVAGSDASYNASTGVLTIPRGDTGATGATGPAGADGADGADGSDANVTAANVTGVLIAGTGISIASNGTITNSSPDQTVALTGTGATTITGTYPNFTINSTNTTYTVGDGGLTTNDFTDADHSKLDGIEANATADQTGAEIKTAYEAEADTNAFTDADHTKLDGIEANADVTDTANVTAAGALMDSEVTNLAQVKAFDSSDYATAAQGSTADSALQNVVEDTTPQLGGNLDAQDNEITDVAKLGVGTSSPSYTAHVNYSKTSDLTIGFHVSYESSSYDGRILTVGEAAGLSAGLGKADGYGLTAGYVFGASAVGLRFETTFGGSPRVTPCDWDGALEDNQIDLGASNARFDDIYATNTSIISSSDSTLKQDVETLTDAEQRVAIACKGLLRKFRWIDAVEEKGDDARIHFGIIAQDLQNAFTAEGLDAGKYGMFIKDTWWEHEEELYRQDAPEGATEITRLGVRYSELLAFIIAAI